MARWAPVIRPPSPRHSGSTVPPERMRRRMSMTTRLSRSALALLSLVLFASACEDGIGPDDDGFRETLDQYEALDDLLGSTGFAAFQALGDRTPYGQASAIAPVGALGDGPAFAQSLTARLADGPLGAS